MENSDHLESISIEKGDGVLRPQTIELATGKSASCNAALLASAGQYSCVRSSLQGYRCSSAILRRGMKNPTACVGQLTGGRGASLVVLTCARRAPGPSGRARYIVAAVAACSVATESSLESVESPVESSMGYSSESEPNGRQSADRCPRP